MKFLLVVGLLTFATTVHAQELDAVEPTSVELPEIIEIRKSLPMEPTEKSVKDFILNRGSAAGLKAGAYLNVVRGVSITDPVRNKAIGSLNIPVGRIQIIHVEEGLSVARLQSELGNDERPMLEFEAVMIGDQIDLSSISMEAPKASKKRWGFAATEPEKTEKPAVVTEVLPQVVVQPAPEFVGPVAPAVHSQPAPASAEASATIEPPKPSAANSSEQPAFILTPIESGVENQLNDKTSFIPNEKATVSASAAVTSSP